MPSPSQISAGMMSGAQGWGEEVLIVSCPLAPNPALRFMGERIHAFGLSVPPLSIAPWLIRFVYFGARMELPMHFAQPAARHVGVNLRGVDLRMAQ